MSYSSIAKMAQDGYLTLRCRACVAQKAVGAGNKLAIIMKNYDLSAVMWLLAAQPGWSDAWDSALAAQRPGGSVPVGDDPAVITDGMILAAVTAVAAAN